MPSLQRPSYPDFLIFIHVHQLHKAESLVRKEDKNCKENHAPVFKVLLQNSCENVSSITTLSNLLFNNTAFFTIASFNLGNISP